MKPDNQFRDERGLSDEYSPGNPSDIEGRIEKSLREEKSIKKFSSLKIAAIILGLIIVLICLGSWCIMNCFMGKNQKRVIGSGNTATVTREPGSFTGIVTSGSFTMEITAGEKQSLEIKGDDNLLPLIVTEVKDGRLHIYGSEPFNPKGGIHVYVRIPSLDYLDISGSSKTTVKNLDSENLEITTSGASDILLQGSARSLKLSMSGAGKIDGEDLKIDSAEVRSSGAGDVILDVHEALDVQISGAGNFKSKKSAVSSAKVDISGAGNADLWVQNSLDVHISGVGNLEYTGDPKVSQTINGFGSVRHKKD